VTGQVLSFIAEKYLNIITMLQLAMEKIEGKFMLTSSVTDQVLRKKVLRS
jgi:hypothetical protein